MRFSTLSILVTAASAAFSFAAPVDLSNGTGSAGAADGDLVVAGRRTSSMLGGSDVGNDTVGELLGNGSSIQASSASLVSGNLTTSGLASSLGDVLDSLSASIATATANAVAVVQSLSASIANVTDVVSGLSSNLTGDLSAAVNTLGSTIGNIGDNAIAGLAGLIGGLGGAIGAASSAGAGLAGAVGGAVGAAGAGGGGIVI